GRSERYSVDDMTPYTYVQPQSLVDCCNPPQGLRTRVNYTSTNPTIGLKYKPLRDLTLRASYARAFLPPTAFQLLEDPTQYPGYTITDPRDGQSYEVSAFGTGNPALRPQTSRSWNVGAIWEPSWNGPLNGLRLDVEHYKIVQPDYITT